jgi:hypothetical protein
MGSIVPQYAQIWRSRWKSSRLLSGGIWWKDFIAIALPFTAMMLLAVISERSPVSRLSPP